ncbi:Protein of unknown function [Gryllus bimaculatus]|nr:Protein of unknown function [Gryllus bimaculatus]
MAKKKMIWLLPQSGIVPYLGRIISKIPIRIYDNKRHLSAILRHEKRERFGMYYPSKHWQQYATSSFPEFRFYRKLKEITNDNKPLACSKREYFSLKIKTDEALRKFSYLDKQLRWKEARERSLLVCISSTLRSPQVPRKGFICGIYHFHSGCCWDHICNGILFTIKDLSIY